MSHIQLIVVIQWLQKWWIEWLLTLSYNSLFQLNISLIWDVFGSILNCKKMWKAMETDRQYDLRPLVIAVENRITIFLCVLMRQRMDKLPIVKTLVKSEVHSYKLLKWFAGIFRSRFKNSTDSRCAKMYCHVYCLPSFQKTAMLRNITMG